MERHKIAFRHASLCYFSLQIMKTDATPNPRRVKNAILDSLKAFKGGQIVQGDAPHEDTVTQHTVSSSYTTVAYLNSFYGITSNTGSRNISQSVFATGTSPANLFSQSDLYTFQHYYSLPIQPALTKNGGDTSACGTSTVACEEGKPDV